MCAFENRTITLHQGLDREEGESLMRALALGVMDGYYVFGKPNYTSISYLYLVK